MCGIFIYIVEHISTIRNHHDESKPFLKISLCFMFINYRLYILELGGGKNTICCTTGQEIHPCLLWVGSCLWIQRVSFIFTERNPGGRWIWDSIYGQDGKPTQMSGVKNSFNWQVKEVCSVWAVMVLADGFFSLPLCYSWHARSLLGEILHLKIVYYGIFLVLVNPAAQQVGGGTRGIIDV